MKNLEESVPKIISNSRELNVKDKRKPPFCFYVGKRTFSERYKKEILFNSDTREKVHYCIRPEKPFHDPPSQ
jgi:hypothetical protein